MRITRDRGAWISVPELLPPQIMLVAQLAGVSRQSAPINGAVRHAGAFARLRGGAQFRACSRAVPVRRTGHAVHVAMPLDVDQFEVFEPVVVLDAVPMVDLVLGRNRTVRACPHVAMLQPRPAVYDDGDVAVFALVPAAFRTALRDERIAVLVPAIPVDITEPASVRWLCAPFDSACFHAAKYNNQTAPRLEENGNA